MREAVVIGRLEDRASEDLHKQQLCVLTCENEKIGVYGVVVVFPECIGVMSDIAMNEKTVVSSARSLGECLEPGRIRPLFVGRVIGVTYGKTLLDGHQTNAGENSHDGKELPKFDIAQ